MPGATLVLACLLAAPPAPTPVSADTLVDVGGHRLHLEVHRGTAPLTVVFEAGGGADLSSWGPVPDSLAARTDATVVAYDRAGLGSSELGPSDLTPADEVTDLRRALAAVGAPPRTIVVGHSYGGMLALLQAGLYPDAVAGLVLVDPMNPRFVQATGDFVYSTAPDLSDPRTDRERALKRMVDGFEGLVRDVTPIEPGLKVPMAILTAGEPWWPRDDVNAAWRKSHAEMAAAAPNRRVEVVPGTDHDIPNERPGAVVRTVLAVIAEARAD